MNDVMSENGLETQKELGKASPRISTDDIDLREKTKTRHG
jgi:hypothetical protein